MIVLDTETTGLLLPETADPAEQPRIIDLAAMKLCPRTGEELGRFQTLIQPGCPLPTEITKITGYTDADLAGAPTFAEVLPKFAEWMLGARAWCAHNMPFDRDMIWYELVRLDAQKRFPWPPRAICTAAMYGDEFGLRGANGRPRNPKLVELYKAKLGRELQQRHTAMADVEALVEVVRAEGIHSLGA